MSDREIGILGIALSVVGLALQVLWPGSTWLGWGGLVVGVPLALYPFGSAVRRRFRPPEVEIAIDKARLRLEQQQLELQFRPSVSITYQNRRLHIANRGKTDLELWGTIYGERAIVLDPVPRLIAPGDFYYLFANEVEEKMVAHLQPGQRGATPFYVFVCSADKKKHTVRGLMLGARDVAGRLEIHTQTLDIADGWTNAPVQGV